VARTALAADNSREVVAVDTAEMAVAVGTVALVAVVANMEVNYRCTEVETAVT